MNCLKNADEVAAPPAWQIALGFLVLYIVWGTTYLAIKIGVADEQLPPFLFGGARIGSAGLLLLLFQLVTGRSLRVTGANWRGILYGAGFLFVGGNGLISAGLRHVPSGESAVLAATATLWIALFSMTFPGGDRLRPLGWLGLLMGLAGVCLLQAPALREQGVSFANVGPWLVLGSAGSWGIGSVLLRQTPIRVPRLTSAGYQMFLGGGGMVLVGFLLGEQPPERVTAGTAAVFVYLLVFGSLLAFVVFHWLLEHVPATKVATYAYVNPLVAVLLGTWWRHEPITWTLASGMALILMAVFLVRGGERPRHAVLPVLPGTEKPAPVRS